MLFVLQQRIDDEEKSLNIFFRVWKNNKKKLLIRLVTCCEFFIAAILETFYVDRRRVEIIFKAASRMGARPSEPSDAGLEERVCGAELLLDDSLFQASKDGERCYFAFW